MPLAAIVPSYRSFGRRVVAHGAYDIALRVGEEDEAADAGDGRRLHAHPSTTRRDVARAPTDVGSGDRALEADRSLTRQQLPPALQGAHQSCVRPRARPDLKEVGRAPGKERPPE